MQSCTQALRARHGTSSTTPSSTSSVLAAATASSTTLRSVLVSAPPPPAASTSKLSARRAALPPAKHCGTYAALGAFASAPNAHESFANAIDAARKSSSCCADSTGPPSDARYTLARSAAA